MRPGESYKLFIRRQTVAGLASSGKVVGDFVVKLDGVTQSPGNFVEVGQEGSWQLYTMTITMPSTAGQYTISAYPASGTDIVSPEFTDVEIEAYDLDAIAGLVAQSGGIVSPLSASDTDYGDVVQGDAWAISDIVIPLAKISPFGFSDLSGMTISCKLQTAPQTPATPVAISATITSTANRLVKVYFDSFPVGLALAAGAESATWYGDIQLKHTSSGKIITGARFSLRVVWQRDDTA